MSGKLNSEVVESNDESLTESPEVDNTKDDPIEGLKTFLTSELQKFRAEQNKALNGFEKKFKSQAKPTKEPQNQPSLESPDNSDNSDNSEESNPLQLTADALRAEYQQKLKSTEDTLKAEILKRDKDQAERDKKAFQSDVNKSAVLEFASLGFDDIKDAVKIFFTYHNINQFVDGVDEEKIFKTSKDDPGKTLSTLVKEWKESSIGKRFLKAENLVDGAGIEESSNTSKPEDSKSKNPNQMTAQELSDGLKSGQIKLRI